MFLVWKTKDGLVYCKVLFNVTRISYIFKKRLKNLFIMIILMFNFISSFIYWIENYSGVFFYVLIVLFILWFFSGLLKFRSFIIMFILSWGGILFILDYFSENLSYFSAIFSFIFLNTVLHFIVLKNKSLFILNIDKFQYNVFLLILLNFTLFLIAFKFTAFKFFVFYLVLIPLIIVFNILNHKCPIFFPILIGFCLLLRIYLFAYNLFFYYVSFYLLVGISLFLYKKYNNFIPGFLRTKTLINKPMSDFTIIHGHFKKEFHVIYAIQQICLLGLLLVLILYGGVINFLITHGDNFAFFILVFYAFFFLLTMYVRLFIIRYCNPAVENSLLQKLATFAGVGVGFSTASMLFHHGCTTPLITPTPGPITRMYQDAVLGWNTNSGEGVALGKAFCMAFPGVTPPLLPQTTTLDTVATQVRLRQLGIDSSNTWTKTLPWYLRPYQLPGSSLKEVPSSNQLPIGSPEIVGLEKKQ